MTFIVYTKYGSKLTAQFLCPDFVPEEVKAGMLGNKWAKVLYAMTYPMKIPLKAERKRVGGLKMPVVEGKWTCLTVQQYTL